MTIEHSLRVVEARALESQPPLVLDGASGVNDAIREIRTRSMLLCTRRPDLG